MAFKRIKRDRKLLISHWFFTLGFTITWITFLGLFFHEIILASGDKHISIHYIFSLDFLKFVENEYAKLLTFTKSNYSKPTQIDLIVFSCTFVCALFSGMFLEFRTIYTFQHIRKINNEVDQLEKKYKIGEVYVCLLISMIFYLLLIFWPLGFIIDLFSIYYLSYFIKELKDLGFNRRTNVIKALNRENNDEEEKERKDGKE